ncbi:MAG: hypothetical protein WDO14_08350 [Bacteroidota bacterium]
MKSNRKPVVRKRETFEEFLKSKQLSYEEHIDWQGRKNLYLKSVDRLYDQIGRWLKPYEEKSLLNINDDEMEICELIVGPYKVKRRDIFLGNSIISLIPQGTLIVGSVGRVDIQGSKGALLIFETEWNVWRMGFKTIIGSKRTWSFNKQSFQEALRTVIDGYDEKAILD